jgi:hypothetical protein
MPLDTRLDTCVSDLDAVTDLPQVLQRVYKYGGQPFVRDYLAKNHGTEFDRAFGPKTGKAMMHSCAGRSVAYQACLFHRLTFCLV